MPQVFGRGHLLPMKILLSGVRVHSESSNAQPTKEMIHRWVMCIGLSLLWQHIECRSVQGCAQDAIVRFYLGTMSFLRAILPFAFFLKFQIHETHPVTFPPSHTEFISSTIRSPYDVNILFPLPIRSLSIFVRGIIIIQGCHLLAARGSIRRNCICTVLRHQEYRGP